MNKWLDSDLKNLCVGKADNKLIIAVQFANTMENLLRVCDKKEKAHLTVKHEDFGGIEKIIPHTETIYSY